MGHEKHLYHGCAGVSLILLLIYSVDQKVCPGFRECAQIFLYEELDFVSQRQSTATVMMR